MFKPAIYVDKTPSNFQHNKQFPYPGNHNNLYIQMANTFTNYHPQRAGVIPYSFFNDNFYFYLSVDQNDYIGDFGGGISIQEDTLGGALRECQEESIGIFSFQYEDVKEKSLVVYSEEMAIYFVKIDYECSYYVKNLFEKKITEYKSNLDNKNVKLLDIMLNPPLYSNSKDIKDLINEIEVLKSMTEKKAIQILRDDQFGTFSRINRILSLLIYRSMDVLQEKLEKNNNSISRVCRPYRTILDHSIQNFTIRKKENLRKKWLDTISLTRLKLKNP